MPLLAVQIIKAFLLWSGAIASFVLFMGVGAFSLPTVFKLIAEVGPVWGHYLAPVLWILTSVTAFFGAMFTTTFWKKLLDYGFRKVKKATKYVKGAVQHTVQATWWFTKLLWAFWWNWYAIVFVLIASGVVAWMIRRQDNKLRRESMTKVGRAVDRVFTLLIWVFLAVGTLTFGAEGGIKKAGLLTHVKRLYRDLVDDGPERRERRGRSRSRSPPRGAEIPPPKEASRHPGLGTEPSQQVPAVPQFIRLEDGSFQANPEYAYASGLPMAAPSPSHFGEYKFDSKEEKKNFKKGWWKSTKEWFGVAEAASELAGDEDISQIVRTMRWLIGTGVIAGAIILLAVFWAIVIPWAWGYIKPYVSALHDKIWNWLTAKDKKKPSKKVSEKLKKLKLSLQKESKKYRPGIDYDELDKDAGEEVRQRLERALDRLAEKHAEEERWAEELRAKGMKSWADEIDSEDRQQYYREFADDMKAMRDFISKKDWKHQNRK
jgi:hypothetical protein